MADTLHPRNRHRGGLDFPLLIETVPALAPFVFENEWGTQTIDFADPVAIKLLNTALLKRFYGVAHWDIPEGYLCPSIPGRADYIHSLADLLAASNGGVIPRGKKIRALDIGVGANCVYPLIGHAEYGWSFVGSEIDPKALANAESIVASNRKPIELRLQRSPRHVLAGLLREGEQFDVSLCNPPFHASAKDAEEASRRKWKNLGKKQSAARPVLNFGGQNRELWTAGGESAFVRKLIEESAAPGLRKRIHWFTTLVSKSANLPEIERALKRVRPVETKTIELKQGQKSSRIVAWTFF